MCFALQSSVVSSPATVATFTVTVVVTVLMHLCTNVRSMKLVYASIVGE